MGPPEGGGAVIVRVHVERLVVDGPTYGPADGRAVADALTTELTRLLSTGEPGEPGEPGGIAAGRSAPRLPAPPVPASAWSSPAALGRDAARSIHGGLSA
ncbi:MAG: hypothetical protein ACR2MO_14285 [Acidimicrobiales bacterium]